MKPLHTLLLIFSIFSFSTRAAVMIQDSVHHGLDSIPGQPLPYAEEMPSYPGGNDAMVEFLSKNIRYPEEAAKNGIYGKVYVQFVVDNEGNIGQVKVLKGIGGGCDEEAVRLIRLLPKWTPAKDKGKPVSVLYTLPITFDIQEEALVYVEQMPEFPGGMNALLKFLNDSIRYPVIDSIAGREIVQFLVNTNGKISHIEVLRSLGPDYDKESVRLVKSFPDWIPGKQNGKLCAVYYTLPILFEKKRDRSKRFNFNEIITTECNFPGGMDSLSLFVGKHLQYPKDAEEKGIKGIVRVEFKIDKEGKIIRPRVTHKLFPSLDQEALRVVNLMPDWIPASSDKKPVVSVYYLDFAFGEEPKPFNFNINPLSFSGSQYKIDTTKTRTGLEPMQFADIMPEFPGGQDGLMKYLKENIRYPKTAAQMGIVGRVILQFVVTEEGKITNVKVLRPIGGGCDEEAVRVVSEMPLWAPGIQNGKVVPVYFTLPVMFP